MVALKEKSGNSVECSRVTPLAERLAAAADRDSIEPSEFHALFSAAVKSLRLNLEEVSDLTGTSVKVARDWINASRYPRPTLRPKILRVMSLEVDATLDI